jgi:hypothetical protein
MTLIYFLIAYLIVGLLIAACALMGYAFDDEYRREMEFDAGLGFIPHGPAVFAIIVIIASPLFPAAGIVSLVRWLLGIEEGE